MKHLPIILFIIISYSAFSQNILHEVRLDNGKSAYLYDNGKWVYKLYDRTLGEAKMDDDSLNTHASDEISYQESILSSRRHSIIPENSDPSNVDLPFLNGSIMFEEVFNYEGLSKDDIYLYAKGYFVKNASNSNYTNKLDDKDSGSYISKGGQNLGIMNYWTMTVQFDARDDKLRVRFYDFIKEERGTTLIPNSYITADQFLARFYSQRSRSTKGINARSSSIKIAQLNNFVVRYIDGLKKHIDSEIKDNF